MYISNVISFSIHSNILIEPYLTYLETSDKFILLKRQIYLFCHKRSYENESRTTMSPVGDKNLNLNDLPLAPLLGITQGASAGMN